MPLPPPGKSGPPAVIKVGGCKIDALSPNRQVRGFWSLAEKYDCPAWLRGVASASFPFLSSAFRLGAQDAAACVAANPAYRDGHRSRADFRRSGRSRRDSCAWWKRPRDAPGSLGRTKTATSICRPCRRATTALKSANWDLITPLRSSIWASTPAAVNVPLKVASLQSWRRRRGARDCAECRPCRRRRSFRQRQREPAAPNSNTQAPNQAASQNPRRGRGQGYGAGGGGGGFGRRQFPGGGAAPGAGQNGAAAQAINGSTAGSTTGPAGAPAGAGRGLSASDPQ